MRLRLALLSLIAIALLGGLAHLARDYATDYALRNVAGISQDRLRLVSASLSARIERFRYLPEVVARSRETEQLFAQDESVADASEVNALLQRIASASGALALFVTDRNGLTIASSNYDQPTTFVGENYSYRPYFQRAIANGFGSYYAVGATTGEPGYFLATPIRLENRIMGVSIVKIDLLPVEQQWRDAGETVAMSDDKGVIFLASNPAWRYATMGALTVDAVESLRAERRYADEKLDPAPLSIATNGSYEIATWGVDAAKSEKFFASAGFGEDGWTLNYSADLSSARRLASIIALTVVLAGMLGLSGALIVLQQLKARAVSRRAVVELEANVAERTKALQLANDSLAQQITERQEAERQLDVTKGNLTQAEKLASIGQTFAGLSHEINQPLAALQTYIASTKLLVTRQQLSRASENFDVMGDIVTRVSDLTNQLKRLARRNDDDFVELDLSATVRKTLNLLKFRFADLGISLSDRLDEQLPVLGSVTQLDQVVLNLLNNAIDAVRDVRDPRIEVASSGDAAVCTITIDDNGPGIDPAARARLFEPFHTTKAPGEGLGLGLATANRIVSDHHGTLAFGTSPLGGARFSIQLGRVQPSVERRRA